jgi:predicted TIM-barrel fold metal-dependent hydrolase
MAGPRCFADASKEAEWKTCITELATCPNVHMKVGGLQMGAVIIQRALLNFVSSCTTRRISQDEFSQDEDR